MCFCTQYDSHCGHSWVSMTDPCGFCHDFLNCPQRNIIQMCIAPPGVCPQCFGGFADSETIEMIQGPWGCNQMIRSQVGGPHAIPGQWGAVQLPPLQWGAQQMLPGNWGVDHRFAGSHAPIPGMISPTPFMASPNMAMITHRQSPQMICDNYGGGNQGMIHYDDGYDDGYGGYHDDRRRHHKRNERHVRKYKHRVKEGGPACVIM